MGFKSKSSEILRPLKNQSGFSLVMVVTNAAVGLIMMLGLSSLLVQMGKTRALVEFRMESEDTFELARLALLSPEFCSRSFANLQSRTEGFPLSQLTSPKDASAFLKKETPDPISLYHISDLTLRQIRVIGGSSIEGALDITVQKNSGDDLMSRTRRIPVGYKVTPSGLITRCLQDTDET